MSRTGLCGARQSLARLVMDRVNPRVGTSERLRDFRARSPGGPRQGPTHERAATAGRDSAWHQPVAKPLGKLAIETKTPAGLSGGVSR